MSDRITSLDPLVSLLSEPASKARRRRNRRPKACQPCRERKVRCDYSEPCSTCRKRQHPNLCIYADLPNPRGHDTSRAGFKHSSLSPSSHKGAPLQPTFSHGGDVQRYPARPMSTSVPAWENASSEDVQLTQLLLYLAENISEVSEKDEQTGETIHFGRNSIPAFFQCLLSTRNDRQQILPPGISIGSAFGLTNRTPLHPFGSLWAATVKVTLGDILGSLPSTEQCMRYYRAYSQIVLPFAPYLLDPDGFERRLLQVIQRFGDRSNDAARDTAASEMSYDELGWYGLLFAVLASGCQFAEDVSSERILMTRVFVACSFECLRLANFYVQPLPESIQTTLILEYIIANDSNPGVAWTFLALSAKQSESRGLHMLTSQDGVVGMKADTVHPLWQAVIHLDSMLGVAFDRKLQSFLPSDFDVVSCIGNLAPITFSELFNAFSCLKLQWHTMRSTSSSTAITTQEVGSYLSRLHYIRTLAEDDRSALKESFSMQSKLEQLVLVINLRNFEAEVFRAGALYADTVAEQRGKWFCSMEASYVHVVEAFLFLKPLSPIALSWSVLFCSISSGLALAGLDMVQGNRKHHALLQSLMDTLAPVSRRSSLDGGSDDALTCCEAVVQVIQALQDHSHTENVDR